MHIALKPSYLFYYIKNGPFLGMYLAVNKVLSFLNHMKTCLIVIANVMQLSFDDFN